MIGIGAGAGGRYLIAKSKQQTANREELVAKEAEPRVEGSHERLARPSLV
jgi:hypothetical protein